MDTRPHSNSNSVSFPMPDNVADLAQALASSASHSDIFRAVFLFASSVAPADGIFVALYDSRAKTRRCVYGANLVQSSRGLQLEEDEDLDVYPVLGLNNGPQSRAIINNEIINSPDLSVALQGLQTVDTGSDFDERPPRSGLAVPMEVTGEVIGAFEVQSGEKNAFDEAQYPYLRMAARLAAIAVRNLELTQRERTQREGILRTLGLTLEHRDYETKGHTDRVVARSLEFGKRVGLTGERLRSLRWGAYLHDVGKISIADSILLKPGALSTEEFSEIKKHSMRGVEICASIPFLPEEASSVVRSHHERWDGTGYPDGLREEEIPFLARMFSLVDVFDALTHPRPYKPAWPPEVAAAHLREQAGLQFDPELVPKFLTLVLEGEDGEDEDGKGGDGGN